MTFSTSPVRVNRKALSFHESKRLHELAREIRNTYKETDDLVIAAQQKGCAAIASAISCGTALNEAKTLVGHGGWLKWLEKHCKGIHFNTAGVYMRLANSRHVVNLKDCRSLRQAYIEVGIIPVSEKPVDIVPTPAMRLEIENSGGSLILPVESAPSLPQLTPCIPQSAPAVVMIDCVELKARLMQLPDEDRRAAAREIMTIISPWIQ